MLNEWFESDHRALLLAKTARKRIAFVSGNFNIIHTGHLRLFKFAREISDFLVVFANGDGSPGVSVPMLFRVEGLKALSIVDCVLYSDEGVNAIIQNIQPNYIVKGHEFQKMYNPELEIVRAYGGKLLFSSGEVVYSSYDLIGQELGARPSRFGERESKYLLRHNTNFENLSKIIQGFKDLKVLVVGDIIVDDYIICDPIGMSQEDPTIVVTPIETKTFVGGAGVVAAHARGLGAKVSYCTVSGDDETAVFVRQYLQQNDIDHAIFPDETRPTTRKQRYRANGKTLLRVNHLRHHRLSEEFSEKLKTAVLGRLPDFDVLLLSDFNYGCLTQELVDCFSGEANRLGIFVAADSQASSQNGDISRFKNMDLITPTEREARLAVNDNESGVAFLAEILRGKSKAKYIVITMAGDGVLVNGKWDTVIASDRLPAFNTSPKDPAGAGDSLFTTTAMSLRLGGSIWESAFIGSLAAACQVGRVGNQPLSLPDLLAQCSS